MKLRPAISLLSACALAHTIPLASAQQSGADWVSLSADTGEILINAPGFAPSKAVSSAFFNADGKNHAVRTKGGKLISKVETGTADTPFGEAVGATRHLWPE